MNRIIRDLIIAAPLATVALTMAPGVANAETPAPTPGPVIVLPAEPGDPGPKDIAIPAPVPPQDIANPDPAPEPDPEPVPDDKAPAPHEDPVPEGPDEITDVPGCTHGCGEDQTPEFPLDGGCFEDCDLPEEPGAEDTEDTKEIDDTEVASFYTTPTRIDAGLGANEDDGLQLTWLLASGALVTVGGAAFVARKRARSNA